MTYLFTLCTLTILVLIGRFLVRKNQPVFTQRLVLGCCSREYRQLMSDPLDQVWVGAPLAGMSRPTSSRPRF